MKSMPEAEEKLIAVPTGKRDRDGEPICICVENNCFHSWHAKGREDAWGGAKKRVLHESNLSRFNGASQINLSEDASVSDSNGEGNTDRETETPTGSSVSMDSNDDEQTGQLVQASLRN